MPAADWITKQGDTHSVISDTLKDSSGTVVNLTGATVKFVMRALTATLPQTNAAATVVSAPAGTVTYQPAAVDTAFAGHYLGNWIATFGDATVMTFPVDGYLDIWIEENLTTAGGAQIVSLAEVKQYLRLEDKSHDDRLVSMINATRYVIEDHKGDILPTQFEEWYDGGQPFILLRHRPVINLVAIEEYRGPVSYPLKIVADPAHGGIYSVMLEPEGRIVRRSAGGGVAPFPALLQAVHVVYVAGRPLTPNITEAALEIIRANYQPTQQAYRPRLGGSSMDEDMATSAPPSYFLPNRAKELLGDRKAPSIF